MRFVSFIERSWLWHLWPSQHVTSIQFCSSWSNEYNKFYFGHNAPRVAISFPTNGTSFHFIYLAICRSNMQPTERRLDWLMAYITVLCSVRMRTTDHSDERWTNRKLYPHRRTHFSWKFCRKSTSIKMMSNRCQLVANKLSLSSWIYKRALSHIIMLFVFSSRCHREHSLQMSNRITTKILCRISLSCSNLYVPHWFWICQHKCP